jgi:flagellar hook-associated protein 1 FlgK
MAGLTGLLNMARDALAAQSYGLNVTSQNITNANTPLYVRREAVLQTQALGTETTGGVQVQGLRRAADAYADKSFLTATSMQSAAKEYDSQLSSVETIFNDSGATGFGSTLDQLFATFQQLSARPSDPTVRQSVLNAADVFASRSNQIADTLASQRTDLFDKARELASQANLRAQEIAKLNQQIVSARQSGADASDLIDQRNLKLLDLAQIVDIHTVAGAYDSVTVQAGSTTLIDGSNTQQLSVQLDGSGNIAYVANRNGSAAGAADITNTISGGQLFAVKQARDVDILDVSSRFDKFVFDVATALNTSHAAGVGLDGQGGRNIFDVGPTADGAGRAIALSGDVAGHPEYIAAASGAGELPGGSSNAVILGNVASMPVVFGNRTPAQAYGDIVGDIGSRRSTSRSDVDLRAGILQQSKAARESVSGVSLDEEMVNLQKYQRAYQATGKVLATIDELLAGLIQKVGA